MGLEWLWLLAIPVGLILGAFALLVFHARNRTDHSGNAAILAEVRRRRRDDPDIGMLDE